MTQQEVAQKIGVTQKDISRWEKEVCVPNARIFGEICRAIGASADEILELKH